jgi:hypothetical protein
MARAAILSICWLSNGFFRIIYFDYLNVFSGGSTMVRLINTWRRSESCISCSGGRWCFGRSKRAIDVWEHRITRRCWYDARWWSVVAFLKAGASVQCVETFSGKLPLHLWASVDSRKLAYQDTYELVCRALLDRTDDWNAKDILRGHTFLHSAVLTHCQRISSISQNCC